MDIYKDTICQKYVQLITSLIPGYFKGIYYGDPVRIPASNYPALIIYKNTTAIRAIDNASDEHQISLTINVATFIGREINDDLSVRAGVADLYDLMEGRDENYKLKAGSIVNIIRNNQIMDSANNLRTDLATMTRTDYGLTYGKREKDAYSVEGLVEFVVNFIQLR